MSNLSVVILTKNEERNISLAINSVKDLADEIIVIDDDSKDKTREIAKKLGAKVVEHKLNEDFASQRNFADSQTKGEWILHLDADETLSQELKKDILKQVQDDKNKISVFYLKRRDWFWGRELRFGETRTARSQGFIRFYAKGSGTWKGSVHETFVSHTRHVGRLNGFIEHKPHPTITDFIRDINRYSTLRAKELKAKGKRFSLFELWFYPLFKFKYTYLLKLGFLDGAQGFVYAFMMSFHSYLVRAKLYN